MRLEKKKILNIDISIDSEEKILEYIEKYLKNSSKFRVQSSTLHVKPLVIVTPNPEQVIAAQQDKRFADLLNQADIAIPDGYGVIWASSRLWSTPLQHRITGIDLMENLVAIAAKERVPIGLIGGRGEVAVNALECLQETHPGLGGWAEEGPEINSKYQISNIKYTNEKSKRKNTQQFSNRATEPSFAKASEGRQSGQDIINEYIREVVERIRKTGTRLVFVGLGAPKQEYFIETLNSQLSTFNFDKPLVLMAVGGAFDVISGRLPRAPAHVRLLGFEWLWRLARQPWRFTRQISLLRFVALVMTTPRNVH